MSPFQLTDMRTQKIKSKAMCKCLYRMFNSRQIGRLNGPQKSTRIFSPQIHRPIYFFNYFYNESGFVVVLGCRHYLPFSYIRWIDYMSENECVRFVSVCTGYEYVRVSLCLLSVEFCMLL